MDAVVSFGLQHALVTSLIAIGVLAISPFCRNPYLIRALWLAVLVKFVVPPLFVFDIRGSVPDWTKSAGDVGVSSTALEGASQPAFEENVFRRDRLAKPSASHHIATTMVADHTLSDSRGSFSTLTYLAVPPLRVVGAIWLFGTFCVAWISLWRIWRFHRLLGEAPLAATELQRHLANLAGTVGVSRIPLLRLTDASVPPLAWCIGRRATILLPSQLLARLAESKVTAILAHEVMHVRRHDGYVRWLEFAAVSLYWWCPLVWFARRRLHDAEERCCDADVLRRFPRLRASYGEALLDTVEFLTHARSPAFAGTGFGTRNALNRRFKMLAGKRLPVRPARAVQLIMFVAVVAVVSTAPMVSSWAELEATTEEASAIARCTVSLSDGRLIEGEVVTLGNDLIVIKFDGEALHDKIGPSPKSDSKPTSDATELLWELSLGDCVKMVLQHDRLIRIVSKLDGSIILAKNLDDVSSLDFRRHTENKLRDVEDAYWAVWRAHEDVKAVKTGRDEAQAFWRLDARADNKSISAADEARCRIHYFQYRGHVESQLADLHRNEERLRYLMGVARSDGRLIKPIDNPKTDDVEYDWKSVHQAALKNRIEIVRQRQQVQQRQNELEKLQADSPNWHSSEASHLKLVIAREQAILRDLELEISHQMADAIRDVDLNYALTRTNLNQATAAEAEFDAVRGSYRAGIATSELLLDALRRSVEATRALRNAQVDYMQALTQVDARKGALLARHGLKFAKSEPK